MSQSLSTILVHIVFSTKQRRLLIKPEIEKELHAYLATIFKDCNSPALIINGTSDHIHVLCQLAKTKTVSNVIEDVKKKSSKWIKSKGAEYEEFYWQNGYGAFSIGNSQVPAVRKYIEEQKEHHMKKSFQEELLEFLRLYEVQYDERYLWD